MQWETRDKKKSSVTKKKFDAKAQLNDVANKIRIVCVYLQE